MKADTGDGVAVEGVGVVAGDGEPAGCSSGNIVTLGVGLGVARGPFDNGVAVEDGRWKVPNRDESYISREIFHTTSSCTIFKIPGVSHTNLA